MESVEAVEGEGAIGLGGGSEADVEGEVMALCGADVLVEGMSEVVGVGVRVVSPVGRGVGVAAGVVPAIDALLSAGTGGGTVRIGCGGEGRSISR